MSNKKVLITLAYFLSFQFALANTIDKPRGEGKFIPIDVGDITIVIPAPIGKDSPIGQAKRFVSAYLANNITIMQSITSKRMINKLKTHADSEAKSYFRTISSYHEMLYFHDLKAMIIAISQGEEIKFYFSWSGSRWIMDEVL